MTNRILSNLFLLLFAFGLCLSLSQAQTVTRIEQTDPSVTYDGSWYKNDNPTHSGGSTALTNSLGARAVIRFTGTGITWFGASDPWSGIANASIDGTVYVVDNYFSTTAYQRPLFTVRGLPSGPHMLIIEATHIRNVNGSGSWIWLDSFEIDNGPVATGGSVVGPGVIEENNPALVYTGNWFSNASAQLTSGRSKLASHSGGGSALAMDANASVTISFNGTQIAWSGYRDEWSGMARVYVDGIWRQFADCYMSPGAEKQGIYYIGGLAPGTHSLTIQATGTKRQDSNGTWIWVDAFHVAP